MASSYYSTAADSELYVSCLDDHAGDSSAMLQCVAAGLEASLVRVEQANETANTTLNSWLLVIAGAMVSVAACSSSSLPLCDQLTN